MPVPVPVPAPVLVAVTVAALVPLLLALPLTLLTAPGACRVGTRSKVVVMVMSVDDFKKGGRRRVWKEEGGGRTIAIAVTASATATAQITEKTMQSSSYEMSMSVDIVSY